MSPHGGGSMWAGCLVAPGVIEVAEVAAPDPADLRAGEVILAMRHGGVCGSDLPYFRAGGRPGAAGPARPGFPLHEIVGRVLVSRSGSLQPGDEVVGWAAASDGLAEQVVASDTALHPLPRPRHGGAPEAGFVVAQPLACVLYAVDQLGDLRGRSVAVLGLGPIGLLFGWELRRRGAARVVGVDPVDRRAAATDFGLDEIVVADSGTWADSLTGDRPDVVVEAVGHQAATTADAVRAVADEGTVYCFGIPLTEAYPVDVHALVRRNLRITGGMTLRRREVLGRALTLLSEFPRLAADLVTHVLPAADAQRAFDAACTPTPGQGKILVTMAG
ncbi:zinc-dependent alcohol dehydrogenase [Actinoalloteichus fjordicus]|uniref:Theronine dehydrogenase-like Zn-dependent dehydrogenase n=1 Tax=Actinoalloteichus fjordicus TaxID=1612552 RepID=A0AAC9LDN3_9PSEU|nr:zinc-binding dehydrogenase [Actinoalloteichus fjordicus]APU15928.1 theronine dehydrogenase-like Zn-dependent dehydrogenase [Actinoalloteichus fjordicus]